MKIHKHLIKNSLKGGLLNDSGEINAHFQIRLLSYWGFKNNQTDQRALIADTVSTLADTAEIKDHETDSNDLTSNIERSEAKSAPNTISTSAYGCIWSLFWKKQTLARIHTPTIKI